MKRPPAAKSSGKGRVTTPPRRIPLWLVRAVLGLVLIAAGVLKIHELAIEAQDDSAPTMLLMVFAEAEVLGGFWMVVGVDPIRTHRWAIAAFVGLAIASLFQALAGKCSCGCFGGLSVNPWFVLVFDLAGAVALLVSRPPGQRQPMLPARALHWFGLVTLALLIGVAGWTQADLVTIGGTATAEDGRPLEDSALTFIGVSGKIILRTDDRGNFHLPLVRPGLYAVSGLGRALPIPVAKSERSNNGPAERAAKRSRKLSVSSYRPGGGETLQWIEIPQCSEYGKVIKF